MSLCLGCTLTRAASACAFPWSPAPATLFSPAHSTQFAHGAQSSPRHHAQVCASDGALGRFCAQPRRPSPCRPKPTQPRTATDIRALVSLLAHSRCSSPPIACGSPDKRTHACMLVRALSQAKKRTHPRARPRCSTAVPAAAPLSLKCGLQVCPPPTNRWHDSVPHLAPSGASGVSCRRME